VRTNLPTHTYDDGSDQNPNSMTFTWQQELAQFCGQEVNSGVTKT
jgi:hypothetical protein